VGAVEHDGEPAELEREGPAEEVDVVRLRARVGDEAADSAPRARGARSSPWRPCSISSSQASGSFVPSEENSLMPLSSNGLWDALSTMPPWAPSFFVRSAIAGVGSTPTA